MKIMSREFSSSEKILIVVLFIILLGLAYYKFVFLTTQEMISSLESEVDSKQTELDIANAKVQKLEKLQKELDETSGQLSKMESYNNSKKEAAFLNKVLSGVKDYSVSFSEITRYGNQIRRSFTLQFVVKDYKEAKRVVKDLTSGEYRCLVDDLNYSVSEETNDIYINLTATFFETMVGGVEDSALPEDEAALEEEQAQQAQEEGTE